MIVLAYSQEEKMAHHDLLGVAIGDLENKEKRLREKYKSEQEFNLAAWREYGSELCSGEMLNNERKILEEISATGSILKILLAVRDHGVDLRKKKEEVEVSIKSIDIGLQLLEKRIDDLRRRKARREAKLARINKARSFLL